MEVTLLLKKAFHKGDQIGRIVAQRAIAYFGQFFLKITEVAQILGYSFGKSYVLFFTENGFGQHFGRFFRKLIRSPCFRFRVPIFIGRWQ
jgi:hypothetical protein